jgi:hypothetical protein
MNQPKPEPNPWPGSPWLGEGAAAQWVLWQASIAWAARTNWFTAPPTDAPIGGKTTVLVDPLNPVVPPDPQPDGR